MVVQERPTTVEEFWAEYAGKPYELVRGRIVEVSPSGMLATRTAAKLIGKLDQYLESHPIGVVTSSDGGFWLDPTTLRSPDVGYFSNEKAQQIVDEAKFAPFPPDLAVEVVSPGDEAAEIHDKVNLYLDAGVQLVWVFYPQRRDVVVHYPDRTSRTLGPDDALSGEGVLPGFSARVGDLFPPRAQGKG